MLYSKFSLVMYFIHSSVYFCLFLSDIICLISQSFLLYHIWSKNFVQGFCIYIRILFLQCHLFKSDELLFILHVSGHIFFSYTGKTSLITLSSRQAQVNFWCFQPILYICFIKVFCNTCSP